MLCDICGKQEATVHITEIVNGQMAELHLCEECARKKNLAMEQHFSLSDLLGGLAEISTVLDKTEMAGKRCSNCGMTYEDFRKTGRLGCSECYVTFRDSLASLLKRIHGSGHHLGRFPLGKAEKVKAKMTVQDLRARLATAIQLEEYERAAKLRDQIRILERKNQKKTKI